jgi:GGDEF domain-containing protein
LSEKLRRKVEQSEFGSDSRVTISIGATLFKEGDSQDMLLSRSDKALYQAKENGRNNTVLA